MTITTDTEEALPEIPVFSGDCLDQWMEEFNYFSSARRWNESKQFELMPLCFSGKARDWFELNVKTIKYLTQLKSRLYEKFGVTQSKIQLTREIFDIKKQDNESMRRYIARFQVVFFKYKNYYAKEQGTFPFHSLDNIELFTSSLGPSHAEDTVRNKTPKSLKKAYKIAFQAEDEELARKAKEEAAILEFIASARGTNVNENVADSNSNKRKADEQRADKQKEDKQKADKQKAGMQTAEKELLKSKTLSLVAAGKGKSNSQLPLGNDSKISGLQPLMMLKKIKQNPPPTEIANSFFQFCIVVASRPSWNLKQYKNRNESKEFLYSDDLGAYVTNYFSHSDNEMLNYAHVSLIGHLLLCGGIPNSLSAPAEGLRAKIHAKSVFDADINTCDLVDAQKKIYKKYYRKLNNENAKVCGFIMCQFMMCCINNKKLPDIDFVSYRTAALTDTQKDYFIKASK